MFIYVQQHLLQTCPGALLLPSQQQQQQQQAAAAAAAAAATGAPVAPPPAPTPADTAETQEPPQQEEAQLPPLPPLLQLAFSPPSSGGPLYDAQPALREAAAEVSEQEGTDIVSRQATDRIDPHMHSQPTNQSTN
jgi:hypothetical protein